MWRPIRQFPLLKTYRSFPQPPFFPPPSLSHPQDTPSQVSSEGQRGPWRAKGAQNTEAVSKDKCRAERQEGFSARGLLGMNGQGNTTQFLAPQTLKEPPWLAWLFLLLSPSHAHRTHLSPEEQRMPWRAQPGGRRGPQRSEKPPRVEDQAGDLWRLPRAKWMAQHQMDFPLCTRRTIPWLPPLYLPSLLYLQDLHGQRVSLEVALEDRGGP